jgi:NADH:ubiquinone oxidoreductase subunit F (NADH-binding)
VNFILSPMSCLSSCALPGVSELLQQADGPLAGDQVAAVLPCGYSLHWLRADRLDMTLDPDALKTADTRLGASIIVIGSRQGLGLAARAWSHFSPARPAPCA